MERKKVKEKKRIDHSMVALSEKNVLGFAKKIA